MGNRPGEAICLRHLGRVHHLHGDHHEALSALDKSLTLCLRRDDAEGQAQCHEFMAGVHLDLGDARLAIQHLEESLAMFKCRQASSAAGLAIADETESGRGVGDGGGDSGGGLGGMDEGELIAAVGTTSLEEIGGDGRETPGGDSAGEKDESSLERVQKKLEDARTLIQQASAAYEDYDQALRRAQTVQGTAPVAGASDGDEGGVDLGTAHRKPLLIDVIRGKKDGSSGETAGAGADVVSAPSGREETKSKNGGPKFPLKFKLKVPGQDMSSHFKFLQSWSVHKKYYQTSDEADPQSGKAQ